MRCGGRLQSGSAWGFDGGWVRARWGRRPRGAFGNCLGAFGGRCTDFSKRTLLGEGVGVRSTSVRRRSFRQGHDDSCRWGVACNAGGVGHEVLAAICTALGAARSSSAAVLGERGDSPIGRRRTGCERTGSQIRWRICVRCVEGAYGTVPWVRGATCSQTPCALWPKNNSKPRKQGWESSSLNTSYGFNIKQETF